MSSVSHASASLKSASGAGTFASVIDLLGRLAIAALFLPAGLNKIAGF